MLALERSRRCNIPAMPNPAAVSHQEAQTLTGSSNSPSSPSRISRSEMFPGGDPSVHMLGVRKNYARVLRWVAISFVIGAAAALVLIGLFSM
jgi:hypothetical protein